MPSKDHYFEERPMNVEQAMKYLQISRTTLYRWMKAGLPSVRMGQQIRFWKREVDEWLTLKSVEKK